MSHSHLRRYAAIAAACAAFFATDVLARPLAKPYAGPVPKSEARAAKTEAHRVRFDFDDLKDLAPGEEVDFTAPNGKVYKIVFDRIETLGGDTRHWIGHAKGHKGTYDTIITQGPGITVGRIATPDGEFSLTPGSEYQLVLDESVEKPFADISSAANDMKVSPISKADKEAQAAATPAAKAAVSSCTTGSGACTIDLMVVYTPAMRSNFATNADIKTYFDNVIASINAAYVNSLIGVKLRLVNIQQVGYVEGSAAVEPDTGLDKITPLDWNGKGHPFDSATFGSIESLRKNTYGADMVLLYMNGAPNGGSGIAWIPNGALSAADSPIMYSAIEGCWNSTSCLSFVLAHELGHNMGNAHDRATATYEYYLGTQQQGIVSGSFPYSYGHYRCNTGLLNCNVFAGAAACAAQTGAIAQCGTVDFANNFADIMAYFQQSATHVMKFSSPLYTCSGSNTANAAPCGVANSADAALTIRNNAVVLANMTATVIPEITTTPSTTTLISSINPSDPGENIVLQATVSGSAGTATGTVAFLDGASAVAGCGSVALVAGVANCQVSTLTSGTHSITASYGGNASYAGSTSTALGQVVRLNANVSLTLSQNPVNVGTPLTMTAQIAGASGGTVMFSGNGPAFPGCSSVPVNGSGVATCTVSDTPAGSYDVLATFYGDANVTQGWGYQSLAVRAVTSTTATSTFNPSPTGAVVSFTGTVAGLATPGGTMSFYLDNAPVAGCMSIPMSSFSVQCAAAINGVGTHVMVAQYNGTTTSTASTGVVVQTVNDVPRPKTDLNNDGKADLLWQHTDGRTSAWIMNGATNSGAATLIGAGTGWSAKFMRDFDGDGQADILWQHTDGRTAIWLMNGTTLKSAATLVGAGTGWSVKLVGDFNGDGKADLLWVHTDGRPSIWLMNGTAQIGGGPQLFGPATGWSPTHLADLNGDGKADILWKHTDGRVAAWLMDGANVATATNLINAGSGWFAKLVGDFNGDGKADILWEHTDGRPAIWLMNGTSALQIGSALFGPGTGWFAKFAKDFNLDGKADLYWEHTDGRASIWIMNGVASASAAGIRPAGTGYSAKVLADFSGDGRTDILWQHADGRPAIWLMSGTSQVGGGPDLFGPGTGWTPVGALE